MACQTSMSRWWANMAISLTSAMFTCRKVFSSSLASSASLGEPTGTVVSTSCVVEVLNGLEGGLVDAGDDLRGLLEAPDGVARVDPLRAVAEVEVGARDQARALLQDRREQLLGGAGVGGRLQDDGGSGAQVAGEGDRRLLDVAQVRGALVQRGRHGHDGDVETAAVTRRLD